MLTLKRTRKIHLDKDYEYMPRGKMFMLKRAGVAVLLNLIVFPLMHLTHGLRIYGKQTLKKHNKEFKNGAITISNHVFMWDYLAVLKCIRPQFPNFPAWDKNIKGPTGGLIRTIGGIPVPTKDLRGMIAFKNAFEKLLKENKWIHFFPEGSLWFYYPDIRPLKPAVFELACKFNKPVIPIGFSFRKRRGLYKLFWNMPCVDVHIGVPLLPNNNLPMNERIKELHLRSYIKLQNLVGIKEGDPTFNINQNIDEYKKTI
jgi:1-acyl-sn-glycerol-3-phosphate acyltransferase